MIEKFLTELKKKISIFKKIKLNPSFVLSTGNEKINSFMLFV